MRIHFGYDPYGKRAFDVVGALALLPFLAVPTVVAMIAIWVSNPFQSPLFLQERVGKDGFAFTIIKLRTMFDGKVTWLGRWLRRLRIDEFPQLINIIRGDMSFVGPRAATKTHVEDVAERFSNFAIRHVAYPGVFGLAQAGGSKCDVLCPNVGQTVAFDLEYALGCKTLCGDLRIIVACLWQLRPGAEIVASDLATSSPAVVE